MPASRERTVTTTNDRQNITWAMKIVQKPSWPAKPPCTNRVSSEEPRTISGAAIGRKISRFDDERPAKSWRTSANAASVPRIVATRVASSPTRIESPRASHIDWSSHRLVQLCSVKPSKR